MVHKGYLPLMTYKMLHNQGSAYLLGSVACQSSSLCSSNSAFLLILEIKLSAFLTETSLTHSFPLKYLSLTFQLIISFS